MTVAMGFDRDTNFRAKLLHCYDVWFKPDSGVCLTTNAYFKLRESLW
jgi:hypothetical protein